MEEESKTKFSMNVEFSFAFKILRGLSNGILQNPIKTSTIGTDIVHVGLHEKSEIKGEKR